MTAAAAVLATHVYGVGIDDLVQTRSGPPNAQQTYFFLRDEQGSVYAATDSTGAVIERYDYGDFGSVKVLAPDGVTVRATSIIGNRHSYTGRIWLAEIGLYEYRHRYYDPSLGRFVSRDPAGYRFGLNLYAYLNGNPTGFVDPFGLGPVDPDYSNAALFLAALGAELWGTQGYWASLDDGILSLLDGTATQMMADAAAQAVANQADRGAGELTEDAAEVQMFSQFFGFQDLFSAITEYDPNADALLEGSDRLAAGLRGGGSVLLLGVQIGAGSSPRSIGANAAESGASRTVIGKLKDLDNLGPGENTLLKHLPDRGSPRLNWQQNSRVLRTEMRKGHPLRDASVDSAGNLVDNTGFLKAERNLLQDRGWTYSPETQLWNPPVP